MYAFVVKGFLSDLVCWEEVCFYQAVFEGLLAVVGPKGRNGKGGEREEKFVCGCELKCLDEVEE